MPNYLDGQNDVKSYMRETMIDWLVDVNNRFRHRRETLYLCVNIVDRYVYYTIRDKSDSVSRSNYQLVGITAYLIASKYEEIYFPEIHQLLSFADYVFSDEDVKKMELKIVNTLKYDLTVPTTNKFLGRFLRVSLHSTDEIDFIEQECSLHVFHDLRSHAPVDRDAAVEAVCAGGCVDLPGAEILGIRGQLGMCGCVVRRRTRRWRSSRA